MTAMAAAIERLAAASEQLSRASLEQTRQLVAQREREEEAERRRRGYRTEPRRLDFLTMAQAVPGLAEQFSRRVPPEFWNLDRRVAVIACPCGEEPAAEFAVPATCECGRAYLYDGECVRVAFSPAKEPVAS